MSPPVSSHLSPHPRIAFAVRLVVEREWRATVRKRQRRGRWLNLLCLVATLACLIVATVELTR